MLDWISDVLTVGKQLEALSKGVKQVYVTAREVTDDVQGRKELRANEDLLRGMHDMRMANVGVAFDLDEFSKLFDFERGSQGPFELDELNTREMSKSTAKASEEGLSSFALRFQRARASPDQVA